MEEATRRGGASWQNREPGSPKRELNVCRCHIQVHDALDLGRLEQQQGGEGRGGRMASRAPCSSAILVVRRCVVRDRVCCLMSWCPPATSRAAQLQPLPTSPRTPQRRPLTFALPGPSWSAAPHQALEHNTKPAAHHHGDSLPAATSLTPASPPNPRTLPKHVLTSGRPKSCPIRLQRLLLRVTEALEVRPQPRVAGRQQHLE